MQIGLYFGSFNPIHIGHLIIANHVLNATNVDKVWFVVSPQNPFKESASLLNEYDRLHLVRKAVEGDDRLRAVDIEFTLPKPSYTSVTLAYLREKYPDHQFSVIMGGDSFQNLKKWKNYEAILSASRILVYSRPGFDIQTDLPGDIQVLDAPLLEISATGIRRLIKEHKSIKYLVPEVVEAEIKSQRYYLAHKK
ncbi:nicotinate (nicotinamide) nucleotide adenylyltransferase [Paraflavisolibacter sp. H34]|uniref:nicotinate (nicotinamide) nucleotide adenylyltransferase n=1 Tax=Huijunlia imazamoxiresistens TaxID=3127457 RepID=UPI0030196B8B